MKSIFKNKKNLLISMFFLALLTLSIGYAFITEKLNINGTTQIAKNNWVIYFDNIIENNNNVSTSNPAAIILPDKVQVDFNVDLDKSQDSYEFTVDMVNDGTIDAQINSIEKSALTLDQLKNLEYTITYSDGTPIKPCDILASDSRREILVKVRLKESDKYITIEEQNLDLSFEINYQQYDKDKVCDNTEETYTLTIDPNGGIYNGSSEIVVIENLTNNSKVMLNDAPTKEDWYFKEWIEYNDDNYTTNYEEEINTITILNKNAYLKADWGQAIGPHTLFIDPKGGTYNGSSEITVIDKLPSGRIIKLGADPVKEGVLFKGWKEVNTVDYNTKYNTQANSVEIIDRDAYIEAEYGEAVAKIKETDALYSSVHKALRDAEPGQTVELLDNHSEEVTNYSKTTRDGNQLPVILDLKGYTLTGTITNYDYLTITNGTIENSTKTPVVNYGTLTMGENDGTVRQDNISIIGPTTESGIGLEQKGIFDLYDGYIEAKIGLKGGYNSIPEEYIVFVDHLTSPERQKVYLSKTDRSVAKTIIDDLPVYYFNLQDAFNTAMESEELLPVYAIRDFEAPYTLTINEDKEVLFDIIGYTVEPGYEIENNGTLTITDSSTTKGVLKPSITITNNNILNIKDINIEETTSANIITNNKTLNLDNSSLKSKSGYSIYNSQLGTINSTNEINISGDGNYSIYNNATDGKINAIINSQNNRIILNEGNLSIEEDSLLTVEKDTTSEVYGVYNSGNGKTTLNGGHIIVTSIDKKSSAYGIYNTNNDNTSIIINFGTVDVDGNSAYGLGYYGNYATITMNGGTINVDSKNAAYGLSAYWLNFNGGTINVNAHDNGTTSSSYGLYSLRGYVNINGGTINAYTNTTYKNATGISAEDLKEFKVSNITIESDGNCIYESTNTSSDVNITGGNLTCGKNGIYVYYDSNINGININAEQCGIYKENYSNYTLKIGTDTELTNEISVRGGQSGLCSYGGIANINRGNFIGETEYGIYTKNTQMNIGQDDGTISQSTPLAMGEKYGLFIDDGTVNFYDGILKGQTGSYSGLISGVADGTDLSNDTETIDNKEYQTSYLIEYENFVKVGETEYNSLNKAIAAIDSVGTMELIKSADIKSEVNIPSSKNITLKMNNYTLNISKQLINNGTMNITDDENGTGKIICSVYECINNKGILNINNFDIEATARLIKNSGTLSLADTNIKVNYNTSESNSSSYNHTVILNTGNVIMNNKSTIDITSIVYMVSAITNEAASSTTTLNGGTIKINHTYSNGTNGMAIGVLQNNSPTSVIINDGLIEVNSYKAYGVAGYYGGLTGRGNVEMNGGTVKTRPSSESINSDTYGIYADKLIFTGGLIDVSSYDSVIGIRAYTANISGGNINTSFINTENTNRSSWGIYMERGWENNTIDNLTINSAGSCILSNVYYYNGYKTTINGGTYTCQNKGIFIEGDTIINNATIHSKKEAIYQEYDNINNAILGGTFISEEGNGLYYKDTMSARTSSKMIIGSKESETKPVFQGANYGIFVEDGKLDLIDADVIGITNSGIYSKGTITIGNESDPINTSSPNIKGNLIGLEINSGIANYYGGIAKGIENGYTGFISGYSDGYSLTEGTEEIDGTTYKTAYLAPYTNFARVGDVEYNSLNKAIEAIETEGTIELIASASIKNDVTIPEGKNITLKMNNYTLNITKKIINNGTLTIIDEDENNGGINYTNNELIINNGILEINNISINGIDRTITNSGTLVLTKSTITTDLINNQTTSSSTEGSCISNTGLITINEGTNINVTGTIYYIYGISNDKETSKVTINDGNLKVINNYSSGTNGYAIGLYQQNNNVQLEMNGGQVEVYAYYSYGTGGSGYNISCRGSLNMTGGTIKARANSSSSRGYQRTVVIDYINLSGGLIDSSGPNDVIGVTAYEVDVSGGTIETTFNEFSTNSNRTAWGLYMGSGSYSNVIDNLTINSAGSCIKANVSNGTGYKTTINGGTYTCEKTGIQTTGGDTIINGGTVNSKGNALDSSDGMRVEIKGGTFISSEGYGLYANVYNNNGYYTNIGEKGNSLDSGSPYIQGKTYGVYINRGATNFYDGILKGVSDSYYGSFNEIEENTLINSETEMIDEEEYKVKYLITLTDIVKNNNKSENNTYTNLQTAIEEASSGDNLELIDNASIFYDITIPTDKEINIDMKGYAITISKSISNNGTLSMIDSSSEKTSRIKNSLSVNLFNNNGILEIEDINIYYPSTSGDSYPLLNNGTASLTNVSITSGYYGVRNNESGSLTMNNCEINASNTGIYNFGILNIDGGIYSGIGYTLYQNTSQDNEIKNATLNSDRYAVYKYKGQAATLNLESNDINGEIDNFVGTINITNGTLTDVINNRSNMTIIGTNITINDEISYFINNKSMLTMDSVTATITSTYNYGFKVIDNEGNLTLSENTFNITKNGYSSPCMIENHGNALESIDNKYYITDTYQYSNTTVYGINNRNEGSNIISDNDLFDITAMTSNVYAIKNEKENSNNIINNINITVRSVKTAYGVYTTKGITTIEKGTIDVTGQEAIGIYIDNQDTEVILGHEETDNIGTSSTAVSTTNPMVKAIGTNTGYGVRKINGKFKYYDGILIGNTDAKPDTTSYTEYKYEATTYHDDVNDYYYCILEYMDTN